jgi:hypothetical protein
MRLHRLFLAGLLSLAILMSVICVNPEAAEAASGPAFKLTATGNSNVGETVQVFVQATGLEDVYAFETIITFDDKKLTLLDAKSDLPGFTISKPAGNNQLKFAHTKIGNVAGDSGDLTLFTIRFRALAEGSAVISMKDVKLIRSNLEQSSVSVNSAVTQMIGKTAVNLMDISGHWAEAAIKHAVGLGLVSGYSDQTFRPNKSVTRSEFVVILARALGLQAKEGDAGLSDIDQLPEWARASVTAAIQSGLVTGYTDGTFKGDRLISRTEAIVLLSRAFGIKSGWQGALSTGTVFADTSAIPVYARDTVETAASLGLVTGQGQERFNPQASTTRAEAVVLLLRFQDYKSKH